MQNFSFTSAFLCEIYEAIFCVLASPCNPFKQNNNSISHFAISNIWIKGNGIQRAEGAFAPLEIRQHPS